MAAAVRQIGAGLAVRGHLAGVLALGDGLGCFRQVDQNPVEKIGPRQVRGHLSIFLIHIIAPAGHVRVVTDHGEAAGTDRRAAPAQLRIAVAAKADVPFGGRDAEGVSAGNHGTVDKALAGHLHCFGLPFDSADFSQV